MLAGSAVDSALSSATALIITPLAVSEIGVHVYGAWLASGDLFVWLQSSDLGLGNLMVQRVGAAHGKGDSLAVARYFGTGMALIFCISFIVGCVGFGLSEALPYLLNIEGESADVLQSCFRLGIVACFLTLLHFGFLAYFRAVQRTITINLLSLVGTVLNLFVVVIMLRHGLALKALAIGMVVRSTWLLATSATYFLIAEWRHFAGMPLYDSAIRREMVRATPATSLGVLAFAVMNSSDAIVVGMVAGNTMVPAYTFTKKAAAVIRSVLDVVAFAAYPGFAHLYGSSEQRKTTSVYKGIITLFVMISVCSAVGYITTNRVFVGLWVGKSYYLGAMFTILFALQMLFASGSMLVNYLYRSTDSVISGSLIFSIEAAIKLAAVFIGCYIFGIIGIPAASIAVSIIFIGINYRATIKKLSASAEKRQALASSIIAVPVICLLMGMIYQSAAGTASWLNVAMGGVLITLISAAAMLIFMRDAKVLKEYVVYKNW
jgi:O-antigen/teichoic acid export membrane protein